MKKNCLNLLLILVLALSLTACGSGGDTYDDSNDPVNAWEVLADEDLSDDITAWQGDDGSQMLLDISTSSYTFRTWYGRVGTGSLFRDEHGLGLQYSEIDSDRYYYLVKEGGGFTVRHEGAGEGSSYGEINDLHFEPSQGEIAPYDISLLDGVWQNALGYTLAFDTQRMRVIECDINDTMSSSALYDWADGRGVFMGGAEVLHPCVSLDGNALVLFPDNGEPRDLDSRSTGVFYRNGDAAAYADLDNAACEESDGRIWYYDGVNYFAVPAGYTLNGDGQACDEDGKLFAPVWSQERYDPAAVWGENWLAENWGGNG